jgi:cation transport regulator ChaC
MESPVESRYMESWYFAYGSNLWRDQMIARTGAIGAAEHPPRIARLANYRLVFQRLEKGGPAYANIVSPGDGVLGVVYRCRAADLEKLDDYERGYERRPIVVIDPSGEELPAAAYIVKPGPAIEIGPPSDEYLQKIVRGATQHGLAETYIAQIVAIARAVD